MRSLQLKANYKVIRNYYQEINNLAQLSLFSEGAVSPAFAGLLRYCAGQFSWTLAEQYTLKRNDRNIRVDGALLDPFKLLYGVWEAKDSADDLAVEVKKKFDTGYPKDNILFQSPERAILWQHGQQILDEDISRPADLVETLKQFFTYQPPAFEQWEQAVDEFKDKVPQLAGGLLELIEQERRTNRRFIQAFDDFTQLVRDAINPNIAVQAVEEMLIQHLLTERIFRKVFDNPDFIERNLIAREIEGVIQALTAHHFSRHDFLKSLDRFYGAIETTAATLDDFSQKQAFLNTVYEKFFQGFSVKVADTHGIVYTPQPIVDFMVKSVEDILQKEFGRSLSDQGVHILDPFVGTGNFILRIMREIRRTRLPDKYAGELHCNEVMLLPYYIASMNIEHDYYELTGRYEPFEGICMVDTFELAEQQQMALFTKDNTERVRQQQATPIFVIIGNPPYNAGQVDENDNNKNRQYPTMNQRVSDTYATASTATLVRKLNDPYVKAIRWATDRLGDEGVIAFVTNNSFVFDITFDGMRKHLEQDFSKIYHIDLKGNARTTGERRRREGGNIFDDTIRVGVGITFFVKKKTDTSKAEIYLYSIDDYLKSREKKVFLEQAESHNRLEVRKVTPDKKHNWLTEGLSIDFETFLPMGTKEARSSKQQNVTTIFKTYSLGVSSNRDGVVYDFNKQQLAERVEEFRDAYNAEVHRFIAKGNPKNVDSFVDYDKVNWSRNLKRHLRNGDLFEIDPECYRMVMYRPYSNKYLYFADIIVDELGNNSEFYPNQSSESSNKSICVVNHSQVPFVVLGVNRMTCMDVGGRPTQCFPFYTYDEDGTHRRENITDWALDQFRRQYDDDGITKWDIFHYVYALLHHPVYRETYAANLKRELPRIPFAPQFRPLVEAGSRLAELHVHYEQQPEYALEWLENNDVPLNWRVDKMRLSKDKTQLRYNDFLTLAGIPPDTFDYRLGNRSALDWVIDQYRLKTDKRSGISNDPNRLDDPQYIVRLIGQVITVSLETVAVVKGLPALE